LKKTLRKSQKIKSPEIKSPEIKLKSKGQSLRPKNRRVANSEEHKKWGRNFQNRRVANSEEHKKGGRNFRRKLKKTRRKKLLKPLPPPTSNNFELTKIVALDCEMVGVGIKGSESVLARVAIVNSYGNVIYDQFVLNNPKDEIVDYRTKWSGIRPEDLRPGKARPFKVVQKEVADIIKGRIVVGHALENDFKALMLSHPFLMTRDTAKYRPLQRRRARPYALRYLAKKLLGVDIQTGEHHPGEDARAALLIYKLLRKDWERYIRRQIKGKWRRSKKKKETAKSQSRDNTIPSEHSDPGVKPCNEEN
jgi:RNA exonuclease 4